ncbi:bifunctional DedA family/phosphatase PAP2 family protein [Geoalkalibacter halelectricus]|uniref:Bifunctional DedA family/phosphatase PAP2 family protein n=1 Tax=Geoalkalibacter halelectricus TaxID=2847045 RepID=A0ABY5ZJ19_9BACT|nr:bifunctional DedA family/phosphatase PAP2 family protein [Geoalkalibacter halelectricus]MDO3376811.1 bifunctional DedA family/phosphatase PAP2 family protein [Geoalkalibacter halelectricus]UWZ79123.1 bifunctional DedA family/phosphatase PAP2 family protein [Geoalkalibacter halelectricus]
MEPWLETFAAWLPSGWLYYACLGLIAFLESLALVGIFVPGSVIIVMAGFFAAHGQGAPLPLMAAVTVGAIFGDLVSYLLGARYGTRLFQTRILVRRKQILNRARLFFVAHGGKSVFFGRFIGILRPFIPLIAGSARMPPAPFAAYTLISAILWGVAYPGLGYFFGASWQRVQVWTGRLSLLMLVFAGLLVINHLFWRFAFPLLQNLALRLWLTAQKKLRTMAASRFSLWSAAHLPTLHEFVVERFSLRKSTGFALSVGFFASLILALVFFWINRLLLRQTPLVRTDLVVYELMSELHHPVSDLFFSVVSQMGDLPILLLAAAFTLLWLTLNNRDFSALILLLGFPAGQLLVLLVKFIFDHPRPLPFFPHFETAFASFPSSHAFSAVAFYGLVVYFILGSVRLWETRFYLIFWASFWALLIGFSRIYLGAHWLSDVLGGLTLGACWLAVLITICEMRFRFGEFPLPLGWRPVKLTRRGRLWILVPAGLAVLIAIALLIQSNLGPGYPP